MYAVEDLTAWDSQLVRSDLPVGLTSDLGPVCANCDIEALALSPSGRLFGVSGGGGSRSGSPLHRGDLIEIDKQAPPSAPLPGGLTVLCNTGASGSEEIVSASFRPGDTDIFWAFQQDLGLVTIDIFDCTRQVQYALSTQTDQFGRSVSRNWEGLAWDANGRFLYASDEQHMYRFDPTLSGTPQAVELVCSNISPSAGEVEALEFAPAPDGRLIGAQDDGGVIHVQFPTDPASFGPDACTITDVSAEILPGSPTIDVESIVFESCSPAVCGDGVQEGVEQCDGDDDAACLGTACLSDCTCALCGDGVVEGEEQCEDNGTPDDDCCDECQFAPIDTPCDNGEGTCDATGNCEVITCGDNNAEGAEECDGTDDAACVGSACLSDCTCAVCGDGVQEGGEECDGDDDAACLGSACLSDCTCGAVVCGDGVVEGEEQCEDNGTPDDDCCDECQFEPIDTPCDSGEGTCEATGNCEVIICGDNNAEGAEECDGTDDAACLGSACLSNCTCAVCGDGVQEGGEKCDGDDDAACLGSACLSDCTCSVCGDSVIDDGEECDTTDTGCTAGEVCSEECVCTVCGNGELDPGEDCDPPGSETCNNLVDDDGDGLIDCHDPDCSDIDEDTCSAECTVVGPCQTIKRDPAIIQFNGGGLDFFSIHGRVDSLANEFDPQLTPFTIAILNDHGIVHTSTIPAGTLKQASLRRWSFKDFNARDLGEDSQFDGVYKVATRFRRVCGQPSYTFKWRIYADLSEATESKMTVQVYGVDELGSVTANWTQMPSGWLLRLSNLGDQDEPGTCR